MDGVVDRARGCGCLNEREDRLGEGSHDGEHLLHVGRLGVETLTDEAVERVRHGQRAVRVERVGPPPERTRELERVEGVAARRGDDALEDGLRQHDPEPIPHELPDRGGAERTDRKRTRQAPRYCLVERARLGPYLARSPPHEEGNAAVPEAADGERERARRGLVDPLRVVDRHDERLVRGERPQRAERGGRDLPPCARARTARCLTTAELYERHQPRHGAAASAGVVEPEEPDCAGPRVRADDCAE